MLCFNKDRDHQFELNVDYRGARHRIAAVERIKVNGFWLLQDPTLFPKSFKAKDINGIIMFSDAKIENKNKPNFYDFGYSFEDIFSCTLLSYNSKWPQQIKKELVKFFEKVAKEAK